MVSKFKPGNRVHTISMSFNNLIGNKGGVVTHVFLEGGYGVLIDDVEGEILMFENELEHEGGPW